MSQSSFVQVLVNASGKKASSTFFPRRPDSEMLLPIVDGNVKSGAGVPTAGTELAMYPWGGRSAWNNRFRSQHGGRQIVSVRHTEWRIAARSFGRNFPWRCRVMPGNKPLPTSFPGPAADQARRPESRRRGGDPEAAAR